jgi:hypothetical protein
MQQINILDAFIIMAASLFMYVLIKTIFQTNKNK